MNAVSPAVIELAGGETRPVGKILAVGRNYAAHAAEMNATAEPVIFQKPTTAVRGPAEPLTLPRGRGSVHHELELVVWLASGGSRLGKSEAEALPGAYGLGLDLTLRDVQAEAKAKGRPWTLAKGFDGSLPLSPFVSARDLPRPAAFGFELEINGSLRQRGHTDDMISSVAALLSFISQWITLEPGDLVLTGTPSGVGPLAPGDRLLMRLQGHFEHEVVCE